MRAIISLLITIRFEFEVYWKKNIKLGKAWTTQPGAIMRYNQQERRKHITRREFFIELLIVFEWVYDKNGGEGSIRTAHGA